jgi:hypothetical protein
MCVTRWLRIELHASRSNSPHPKGLVRPAKLPELTLQLTHLRPLVGRRHAGVIYVPEIDSIAFHFVGMLMVMLEQHPH